MFGSKKSVEAKKKKAEKKTVREGETARETIESIVFAFVLAFLFRTFEAEAFVIPTGSMAPTLFGRHKDIECDQCGYQFQFGASREFLESTAYLDARGFKRVRESICPNCRFHNKKAYSAAVYKGDRILVNKFQYELYDPQRFDIVVFKFPGNPNTNYIKRLIGLPGETIRIHHGNVYKLDENNKEIILRKENLEKQRAIQIPVYDDQFPETPLREAGWPSRWAGVIKTNKENKLNAGGWAETAQGWQENLEDHSYSLSEQQAQSGKTDWLRYRHFAPTKNQWDRLENGDELDPRPRLIGDFCGYNTVGSHKDPVNSDEYFWVGDLTISGELNIKQVGADANITLELTEGFHLYRCHINPNDGNAKLVRVDESLDSDEEIEMAVAQTKVKGKGNYTFRFANVDDRLSLWIDGSLVDFGADGCYISSDINGLYPQQGDLSPVGIAMKSVEANVASLLIERDIYYRGNENNSQGFSLSLDNVPAWQNAYRNRKKEWDHLEFIIPKEHFFVMGDNSPASSDGRFWKQSPENMWKRTSFVQRSAFVGKAFYIYWPHGIPIGVDEGWAYPISYHKKRTNGGGITKERNYPLHYIPFYPNFGRMKRIR